MRLHLNIYLFICIIFCEPVFGQNDPGITFNRVKPEDFSLQKITVDTSYGAVILADIGKSHFEGNDKGWFSLIYEHKRRIRIIDKKGFELATVEIPLYKSKNSDDEEKLESLKAITYNLENGKVAETKLDKDNVFKEKRSENLVVRKFTMPGVKEGSIIEYSYTIKSDYLFNLQPWVFQGQFPRIWSEYTTSIPSFFKYVALSQGYFPYHIKTTEDATTSYMVREQNHGTDWTGALRKDDIYKIPSNNTIARWVIKNIPAMKEEEFTSSIDNHITKIEFQLAGYEFPGSPYKNILGNWLVASTALLNDKDFGKDLSNPNNWLDDMRAVTANSTDKLDEAVKIYKYVRQNFKNKGIHGIYLSQPLKETFKNKNGYVADINLLLTLILKKQKFNVAPVILSTRSNGKVTDVYPVMNKFNYVICRLIIDDQYYYLDASQPYLGFNKLPAYCYNGSGKTIKDPPEQEYFLPDSIAEIKTTDVTLTLDEKNPRNWTGSLYSTLGYNESSSIRRDILEKGKDEFIKKLQQTYTGEYKIDQVELVNLDNYEEPLQIIYKMYIENNDAGFIYFNPMIKEGITENYFKSQQRLYPVEMPFKIDEAYSLTISVPEGYVIDEVPKSTKAPYNENEALFEYMVYKSATAVTLKMNLKFEKATFTKEDYESLREFFGYVVKKHAEQIVFKKK